MIEAVSEILAPLPLAAYTYNDNNQRVPVPMPVPVIHDKDDNKKNPFFDTISVHIVWFCLFPFLFVLHRHLNNTGCCPSFRYMMSHNYTLLVPRVNLGGYMSAVAMYILLNVIVYLTIIYTILMIIYSL
jgi:hypothetical protein